MCDNCGEDGWRGTRGGWKGWEPGALRAGGVMNERVRDGGPAFPTDEYCDERRYGVQPGMMLRDYFAAHAPFWRLLGPSTGADEIETLARKSYAYADAMLLARE